MKLFLNAASVLLKLLLFFQFLARVAIFAFLTSTYARPLLRWLGHRTSPSRPRGWTQLSQEFVEQVTRIQKNENKIPLKMKMTKFNSSGMCSSLRKLKLHHHEDEGQVHQALIVKTGAANLIFRYIMHKPEVQQEIPFYTKLFNLDNSLKVSPSFDSKLDVIRQLAPTVYYAHETPSFYNFLLLMEDLTHNRFVCLQEFKGADLSVCKRAISSIAKVHGTFCGEADAIRSHFPFLRHAVAIALYHHTLLHEIPKLWKGYAKPLIVQQEGNDALNEYQELEELVSWIEAGNGKEDRLVKFSEIVLDKRYPQTLTHSDFRLENIAIRDSDDAVKVLDWQLPHVCSPVVDIMYFLVWSSKSAEVSGLSMDQFQQAIMEHHFQEFNKHTHGTKFTWEQYLLVAKSCVPLVLGVTMSMHYFAEFREKLIPYMRSSINTMMKKWKVLEFANNLYSNTATPAP